MCLEQDSLAAVRVTALENVGVSGNFTERPEDVPLVEKPAPHSLSFLQTKTPAQERRTGVRANPFATRAEYLVGDG